MLPSSFDLRNLIEVGKVGNITRAAQRLGMAQPSLSQSIRKLERALGATLLIRGKSGVSLTRAGKRVFSRAQELLSSWEGIQADAMGEEEGIQGVFALGCHPSVAEYTLPLFLPRLLSEHPGLRFRLVHDLSRKVVDQVVAREVDLGIAVNPVRHPDLVLIPLGEDSFSLWHSPKKRGSDALFCDPDLAQVQWLLPRLSKRGLRYSQIIPSASLEVAASLAASGAGYALLPGSVAKPRRKEGLAKLDSAFPEYRDRVYLVYRSDAMRSRAGKLLVSTIKGCAFG